MINKEHRNKMGEFYKQLALATYDHLSAAAPKIQQTLDGLGS